MKAILLAAGLGTRLRPVTDAIPKCMVPIAGRPLLAYWLEACRRASCDEILVNTHHHHEVVARFAGAHPDVRISYEPVLLGTAGTLRANWDFVADEDVFFVAHADNYTDLDLRTFLADFSQRRTPDVLAGLVLFRTPNPSSCGIVEVDASGWVLEFLEKPAQPRGDLANGAIYIGTSSLRDHLGGPDFSRDVLAKLGGRLLGYEHRGVLVDIGTLEQYERWKDRSLP